MWLILFALGSFYLAAPQITSKIQPGENLVVEDVPPIDSALASKVAQYYNYRSARFFCWLPDEKGMLIGTRFGQTQQVHLLRKPTGVRQQLTFFDERIQWALHDPKPNSQTFVFGMDQGGSEDYQIYRFDRADGRWSRLTDGKSRNINPVIDPSRSRIAFASTLRNGRDYDLYLMDLNQENPTPRLLLENKGTHFTQTFSNDGKWLLVIHYTSINESHPYLVATDTGQRKEIVSAKPQVSYRRVQFSADGKRVFLATDKDYEFTRLGVVSIGPKPAKIKFINKVTDWDVDLVEVARSGQHIAYTTNEDGYSRLHLIHGRTFRRRNVPTNLPQGVIKQLAFSPTGRYLAIEFSNQHSEADVFVYDTKKHKLTRWTESELGGIDTDQIDNPQSVRYPTFDKEGDKPRQIPARIYYPAKRFRPPYPVLISIHGGPESQARPVFLGAHNYLTQEMGIAIIKPNVRGSAGYGKSYLLLDNGKRREDAVKDIGSLLDWIKHNPTLDATRVAVSGGSYGGYMSLASMTHYADRLRCGIDRVGISNFVTFLENTRDYRRDLRRAEYGDERDQGMRILLDMISPLSNAEKITKPLLVLQGKNDPRVPVTEAEQIVKRVRKRGNTVWYILAKDEGHGFHKKANKDFAMLAIISFLEKYLLSDS